MTEKLFNFNSTKSSLWTFCNELSQTIDQVIYTENIRESNDPSEIFVKFMVHKQGMQKLIQHINKYTNTDRAQFAENFKLEIYKKSVILTMGYTNFANYSSYQYTYHVPQLSIDDIELIQDIANIQGFYVSLDNSDLESID